MFIAVAVGLLWLGTEPCDYLDRALASEIFVVTEDAKARVALALKSNPNEPVRLIASELLPLEIGVKNKAGEKQYLRQIPGWFVKGPAVTLNVR